MKIGDEALAVVKGYYSYKVVPVTITGIMDSAKKVNINGKKEQQIERLYQVDSDEEISGLIPSENIFSLEDKDKAKERRDELMGINPKKIEDEKLAKAKKDLEKIKSEGKWETLEDAEDTLIKLLKNGNIELKRNQLVSKEFDDTFKEFNKTFENFNKVFANFDRWGW